MLGATNIVISSDKSKYEYIGYEIAFDVEGLWSFGNDFAMNVVTFSVDSSSSHADNRKNNFFVLGEGPADDIVGSVGAAEKKFGINFSKAKTKFYFRLYYNGDDSYLFVNGKKQIKKFSTFQIKFV